MAVGDVLQVVEGGDGASLVRKQKAVPAPALADVLTAGNDVGSLLMIGVHDDPTNVAAPSFLNLPMDSSPYDSAALQGSSGALGNPGQSAVLSGGSGNAGAFQPGSFAASGAGSHSHGKISVLTDASQGNAGDLLTADGLGDATWQPLPIGQAEDVGAAGTTAQIIAAMRLAGLMEATPASVAFDQQPTNTAASTPAVNEIQRLTGGGVIDGGVFQIALSTTVNTSPYVGVTGIPWDATAEDVQDRAEAAGFPAGCLIVTGGPIASGPFFFEFVGSLAGTNIHPATPGASNLTGAGHSLTMTTDQNGAPAAPHVMSPAVIVQLLDDLGAVCTHDNATTMTVALTVPGGATLGGTLTRTCVAGIATFDDLTVDLANTGYTLTATSGDLAPIPSSAFDITGGG